MGLLNPRILGLLVLAAVIFVAMTLWVGPLEGLVLVVGLVLIGATAYIPNRWIRVAGCIYLTLVLLVLGRHTLGPAGAVILTAAVVALAWLFLPPRVHRRVAFMIPSLVLLIFFTTILMYEAPGSPFASEKVADEEAIEQQMKKFRVAKTPLGFFGWFMQGIIEDGSMGLSVKVQGRTVNELLLPALPVSMSLGLLALVFAVTIGLGLGIRAGLKPNSAADYTSMGLAIVGISLPNFVIGAGFLILFALNLGWLPVAGWGSYGNLILPALTLALPYAAYIARLARTGTIEVMQQDFVRTARAKGLSEREVILKHALKGAILPVVTFLGPAAAGILTGSFVVETLFGIPGMGQWVVNSAINRDYSVVLGTAIIYFTIVTFFNLLVDLAYAWLDPRVREDL
ncbi:MAG: ABC transporter permease [Planctomycetota bacterium]|nr:ABC transporter permease [Planctomycetota bacterium]